MKSKLSYKIFLAFTLTSLLVVVLMVGLIRFYVTRNFADYANKALLERYSDVSAALATEYQTHNGWQALKENPRRWQQILRSSLPRKVFDNRKRPPRPREMDNKGSGSSDPGMLTPRPARRIQRLARRLGLSICKSIAKALGGKIRAVNANSGGLRIEVELLLAG